MISSLSRSAQKIANTGVPFGIKAIPGIGRIILTASCKGGVGKSTVALNTALALQKCGAKVGVFDADIYGPSVPLMTASSDKYLYSDKDSNFIPVDVYGLKTVSIGNAVDKNAALLWKGPFVSRILSEFARKAIWPALDYLVVDTPPGTGDVPLSLAAQLPVDGAILVTTPQKIALADVIRSVQAFKKLKIPILGVVQNMDSFICPHCGTKKPIFHGSGGAEIAKEAGVEILGSLPVDLKVAAAGDAGKPAVLNENSPYAKTFEEIAKKIIAKVPKKAPRYPPRQLPTN